MDHEIEEDVKGKGNNIEGVWVPNTTNTLDFSFDNCVVKKI
jgi:hypothetical protein